MELVALIILCILFLSLIIYLGYLVYSNISGAPFIRSSVLRINQVFKLISIPQTSKIAELGAGDGKVILEFGKRGYSITGYEINPFLVLITSLRINRLKLNSKCQILWQSFWKVNLKNYNVIYVYGIPHIMDRLETKILKECQLNTLIISIGFHFKNLNQVSKGNGVIIYQIS